MMSSAGVAVVATTTAADALLALKVGKVNLSARLFFLQTAAHKPISPKKVQKACWEYINDFHIIGRGTLSDQCDFYVNK